MQWPRRRRLASPCRVSPAADDAAAPSPRCAQSPRSVLFGQPRIFLTETEGDGAPREPQYYGGLASPRSVLFSDGAGSPRGPRGRYGSRAAQMRGVEPCSTRANDLLLQDLFDGYARLRLTAAPTAPRPGLQLPRNDTTTRMDSWIPSTRSPSSALSHPSSEPTGSPHCRQSPERVRQRGIAEELQELQRRSQQRRKTFQAATAARDHGQMLGRAQALERRRAAALAARLAAKEHQAEERRRQQATDPLLHELQTRQALWLCCCLHGSRLRLWATRVQEERDLQHSMQLLVERRRALAAALSPLVRRWRLCKLAWRVETLKSAGASQRVRREATAVIRGCLQMMRINSFKQLMFNAMRRLKHSARVIQRATRRYLRRRQRQVCDFLISWAGLATKLRREMPSVLHRLQAAEHIKLADPTSRAEAVQRLKEDYTALLATPTTPAPHTPSRALTPRSRDASRRRQRLSTRLSNVVAAHDGGPRVPAFRPSKQRQSYADDDALVRLDDTALELLPDLDGPYRTTVPQVLQALIGSRGVAPDPQGDITEATLARALGCKIASLSADTSPPPIAVVPRPASLRSIPRALSPRASWIASPRAASSRATSPRARTPRGDPPPPAPPPAPAAGGEVWRRVARPGHPTFRWMLTQREMAELLLHALTHSPPGPEGARPASA